MTEQEAIEELKHDCNELGKSIPCDTSWGQAINTAYGMAIAALEKQIPTKPIRKSWELPRCPSCGAALGEWLGDGYTKDWESKTVCDCGQQIDWS